MTALTFLVAVSPIPPLCFKPYFVTYDSSLPALSPSPSYSSPCQLPNYILGIGQGRVIVLVDLPSPEPDKPFLDFCEHIAIGHGADTNDLEIRH